MADSGPAHAAALGMPVHAPVTHCPLITEGCTTVFVCEGLHTPVFHSNLTKLVLQTEKLWANVHLVANSFMKIQMLQQGWDGLPHVYHYKPGSNGRTACPLWIQPQIPPD